MDAMSEPASGSDSANAPRNSPRATFGSSSRRCSGEKPRPRPLPRAITLATLIQARASSSATMQYSNTPRPSPPYSVGTRMPNSPMSAIADSSESGISPCTGSSSLATGSTRSIAKRRTASRIDRRSSVAYALGRSAGAAERGCMGRVSMSMSCLSTNKHRSYRTTMDFDPTDFPLARKGHRFEDFEVGQVWTHHWGRTITAGDNALFSTATCHWSPMYLNAEFARAHDHPDAVVNPMLALCVAIGLSVEDLSEAGGPFLGVEDCVFHRPLYPGD